MRTAENIESLIKNIDIDTDAKTDDAVLGDVIRAFEQSKDRKTSAAGQNIWRIIMRSTMTKLAAVIVLVVAVMTGIKLFNKSIDIATVAWGDVVKNLEPIHTYSFQKIRQETTEPKQDFESSLETKVYYCAEYGEYTESFRSGQLSSKTYTLFKEKEFVGIIPLLKVYERRPLSEDWIRNQQMMMPRQVVKRFLEADYKKLGQKTIDGVRAEGVEINDPEVLSPSVPQVEDFIAQLWVDVENGLPVHLELEFSLNGGQIHTKIVFDKFQWNIQLDASDFEPNIPADYTLEAGSGG
ncbi:MAG: hypothetical protein JW837_11375 [Sedimentisphaerales bacterium]|nr:hypothetical protein [Sedimentisphaerales bacterium]